MSNNKFNFNKRVYWLFFLFTFLLSVYVVYQYNRLESEYFSMEFNNKISRLYDVIRKITPFYLNTNMVESIPGTHLVSNVSIMVNEEKSVKKLSSGINLLETEIKESIGDDYWSIAILQQSSSHANTVHVKPLREVHRDLNSKFKFDTNWISRILENENMSKNYEAFAQCDLKLTEPYIEKFSEQRIRTVFYPIYINRNLKAIFLLDVKDTVFINWLANFNKRTNSFLQYSSASNVFFSSIKTIDIPCAPLNNTLILSVNIPRVLFVSLAFSILITSIFFSIAHALSRFMRYYSSDQMSGLYRRDFYEIKLNRTSGKSIIIVDIDNFKMINDKFGHLQGDLVIKEVSLRLQKNIRDNDFAIRWGGEEFVIVINDISYAGLLNRVEAIRYSIASELITGINVTVSIGATTGKQLSFKAAFKQADTALYQSKHSGRNRATVMESIN